MDRDNSIENGNYYNGLYRVQGQLYCCYKGALYRDLREYVGFRVHVPNNGVLDLSAGNA